MKIMMKPLPLLLAAMMPATALAATGTTTPASIMHQVNSPMPAVMSPADQARYKAIFAAVHENRLSDAATMADAAPQGLLTATAQAEIWLSPSGSKPSPAALAAWLSANTDLPQAEPLMAMAHGMGLSDLPSLPHSIALHSITSPGRERPMPVRGDSAGVRFSQRVKPLLSDNRIAEAEALLNDDHAMGADARTEWGQRISWYYYLANDDTRALSLAARTAAGGRGEWAVMADWVAGLAAFRSQAFDQAASHFARVASLAAGSDLAAAGQFWTARAEMASGRPQQVSARLRTAARYKDSFYGLLAARSLGLKQPAPPLRPDFILADWKHVETLPGARRAAALAEIGEMELADKELRYLAITGQPENHVALTHLAAKLDLPTTQYWLAHNAPDGVTPPLAARYPAPSWAPSRGWRVDRALVFAHALQESRFMANAKSSAGARGIMQLMPATAREVADSMAMPLADNQLTDPSFNIECGQTYLESLRDSPWTAGLLPKVIAAYNAGPGSVRKWNEQLRDNGDPLLFIESIPFGETRHYVEIVLKNYWMYQDGEGNAASSLDALAQGMWPRFPGMPGKTALRLDSVGLTANAN